MASRRRTWLAIAIGGALLAAVSLPVLVAARAAATRPAAAAPAAVALSRSDGTLAVDGRIRTYTLLRPTSLATGARVPLVVVLHGGYGNGEGAISQGNWDAAAARAGFMVVAPNGVGRAWNAGGCCGMPKTSGIDDVKFIRLLVRDLARRYAVDPGRVFAAGMSNGGMMAYRLACDASDMFAAVAPVGATLFTTCAPARPVSVIHIHGLADQNVPYGGGVGPRSVQANPPSYPPVREGLLAWAATDGCRGSSSTSAGPVTTERWAGCRRPAAVELITIEDGGHSWPGGRRMSIVLDPPSTALDATSAIWAFFAAHPRP